MKRCLLLAVTSALLLTSGAARTQAQGSALGFFKNYFITGDYEVSGVGLRGVNDGDLTIANVPPDADIAAAFLYWQVEADATAGPDIGAVGARFRGYPLFSTDGPFAKLIGTGVAREGRRVYAYRADVLRYLAVDPATSKLAANGPHAVKIPNGGGVASVGASLVVVYRDSTRPLSAIVLYDGAATRPAGAGLTQTIQGFYDAATSARLTHIVGGGDAGTGTTLRYNGTPVATNAFTGSAGPGWDNPTVALEADPARPAVTTSVDAGDDDDAPLTWSAIVYRTTVKDFDGDGLLDLWESSTTPIVDPTGQTLPNLKAMGAAPDRKDVFIEIGYMKTTAATTYGGVSKPAHSHLPGHEALKLVGDAFAAAPTGAIAVHFDVGPNYPAGPADPYIIRNGARGGEAIDEAVTVCTPGATDAPWVCQFSAYPGTVGWKAGFRFLRDEPQVLFDPPPPPGVDCDATGVPCERRFDRTRLNLFHYALFAHAVGLPESELPCLDATGAPVADVNDQCAVAPNPAFHTPRTITGVGDFPGGDALVTLGAFADVSGLPIGTPFMQASTLMHEFGHNAERRHGGEAFEQNCKPTYLSTMNYLYQLRGLLDDSGTPRLDYSRAIEATVDESALSSALSFLPYRIGWYAPLATSYLAGRGTAARNHCNGSPLLPTDQAMVRIDARTAAGVVDWDADGNTATRATTLDVNFNGRIDGPVPAALPGSEDWSALRLDQVGARRNVGALYLVPGTSQFAVGPLSLDSGKGDLGKGDLGKGDLGKGDLGKGDLGKGDLGKGDLGKGDLGKGDLGKGDLGGGDLFDGDPNNPGGELDATIAGGLARTPPNQFSACVTGETCAGTPRHTVALNWTAPNVGGVASYTVYRVAGSVLQPGQTWTTVTIVPATLGRTGYEFIDTTALVNGAAYTYFAVATYSDGVASDPSNLVTITAFNDPPAVVFVGVKNLPPPERSMKSGSTVPLSWRYEQGGVVVDTTAAQFAVTAVGPGGTFVNTDPGKSGFRYAAGTWSFNLQTKGPNGKAYPEGVYTITVRSLTANLPSSPPFTLNLTK